MSQQVKRGSREYYNFKITSCSTKQCVFVSVYVRRTCKESCPSLCDPMDCNPPGYRGTTRFLCPWNSPGNSTGMDNALLQGIFPTRGSNPGLLHCRQIFLPFEPLGKPIKQINFKYLTLYFASNHHSYENIDICMTILHDYTAFPVITSCGSFLNCLRACLVLACV